jgi:hypothetical protein
MHSQRRAYLQDVRDRLQALSKVGTGLGKPDAYSICRGIWPAIESIDIVTDIRVQDVEEFVKNRQTVARGSDERRIASAGLPALAAIATLLENSLREPPPPRHSYFPGIENDELRTILERDVVEAFDCFERRHFKACMTLCGSVLEAALLEYFRRKDGEWVKTKAQMSKDCKADRKDITSNEITSRWMLKYLIDLASDNKLFPDAAAAGLKAWFWKARNLVHPAAELRRELEVSETMARKCMAELVHALEILAKWPAVPGAGP